MKKSRRLYSMQTNSENCEVFFIEMKEFKDKFYNNNPAFKHILCEKLELQEQFHEELQEQANAFKLKK